MPINLDVNIRSEEVQEILTAVPNWMIRWGNTLILALLFLFILMSWFIKYPDVIPTQIIVTTIIPPEKIYAKTSGKFDVFFVKDTESIKANSPLAIIENSAKYQDILFLKSITDTIKVDYVNFYFPITKIPLLILGEVESSYAMFESNYTEYYLYKKLQPFKNDFLANKLSAHEAKNRLHILLNQQKIYKKELIFKENDLKRNRLLFLKGILSKREIEQKELDFLREQRLYQNLKSSISNFREGISNSNRSLKGNEIKKIQEENRILKQVIQSYNLLKKAIKDWEMRYVLKASVDGKVSLLDVYNENQSVRQGDLVFTIIPNQYGGYVGKIKAPVHNSGKLKIGQQVNIKLSNYPSEEFGMLKGTIKSISLISDKDGNYLIDVELPNNLETTYRKQLHFKQEMQGTAEIITEDLRLMERFFYQLRSIFDK
jgi:hypothetical protein